MNHTSRQTAQERLSNKYLFTARLMLFPLISCMVILLVDLTHADILDVWHWRNPTPFIDTMQSVCFGNGIFVAVGNGGLIHTSSDGLSWDDGQRPVVSTLNRIIYANNLFIAVGNGGAIVTSTNGVTWSPQTSGTTVDLLSATYGNGRFVAGGRQGNVVYSTDAVSWTGASAGSNDLDWITFGNGLFMAPVIGPVQQPFFYEVLQVRVSSDLQAWATITLTNFSSLHHHVWAVEFANGRFVATAADWQNAPIGGEWPDSHFYYSTDGTNWTRGANANTYKFDNHWERLNRSLLFANGFFGEISVPGNDAQRFTRTIDGTASSYVSLPTDMADTVAMAYGNGRFVVVGRNGKVWISTDTTNWTTAYGGFRNGISDILFDSNKYLLAAASQPILVSSDGMSFSPAGNSPTGTLYAIGFDGSNYVAVGGTSIYTSSNSTTWVQRTSNTTQPLTGVTRGSSRWVAVGWGGTVVTSPNALAWTLRSSGTANNLNGVAFGNDVYVAIGLGGTIISSADGTSWDVQLSGTTADLNSVRFLNGQFVAVGASGTLLVSTDGSTWSGTGVGTTATLYDVAFGNGRYLAGGLGNMNVFITSTNGVNWQDISVKIPTTATPQRIVYLNQSFWIAGSDGLLLQSDSAGGSPLLNGTMLPGGGGFQLKITRNVPPSYRIQVSTNAAGNLWQNLATNSAPVALWTDTNIVGSPLRMYRIVSP